MLNLCQDDPTVDVDLLFNYLLLYLIRPNKLQLSLSIYLLFKDGDGTYALLQKSCPRSVPVQSKAKSKEQTKPEQGIDDIWIISKDQLSFTKCIGRGSFGEVWFGKLIKKEESYGL